MIMCAIRCSRASERASRPVGEMQAATPRRLVLGLDDQVDELERRGGEGHARDLGRRLGVEGGELLDEATGVCELELCDAPQLFAEVLVAEAHDAAGGRRVGDRRAVSCSAYGRRPPIACVDSPADRLIVEAAVLKVIDPGRRRRAA